MWVGGPGLVWVDFFKILLKGSFFMLKFISTAERKVSHCFFVVFFPPQRGELWILLQKC